MTSAQSPAQLLEQKLAQHGIADSSVLSAFRAVPRESFVRPDLVDQAYRDAPLPIGRGQTISQPYIVALMAEALQLRGRERVLEVGTGSGYAAAILSQLAAEVFTIERHETLANEANARLSRLGYRNVQVRHGDGTLGWPEHAPYDAIAVAAGGPEIPTTLLSQLTIGGRLVIPVGAEETAQELLRVTREGPDEFRKEVIADVRFVPLIGEHGWPESGRVVRTASPSRDNALVKLLRENVEPLADIDSAPMDRLLERARDARVVLLGESTHGSSEFYRMRARITKELIERAGFNFVAVEADWPDAARIDQYVLGDPLCSTLKFTPFARFPTWMWRNQEVSAFVEWLRVRNLAQPVRALCAGFHGLDLYSMFTSIAAVLTYLDDVDPDAAQVARERYGSLTPWQKDPAAYGRAVLSGRYTSSESAVVGILREMLERRIDYARKDGERFFDAAQNARVVANAERYYRAMYYGSTTSWNLRDSHMFETLEALLMFYGPESKGIVWEHNSHVGDATATEMSARGELNLGQLCREKFGQSAYIIGFGTDHGTVAAASNWGGSMQVLRVRPARAESYERICHNAGLPAFTVPLREPKRAAVRDELLAPRLERAIGVIYRPETELQSHYFYASLPRQFDEFVWFDETRAITPLGAPAEVSSDLPETYPFGL